MKKMFLTLITINAFAQNSPSQEDLILLNEERFNEMYANQDFQKEKNFLASVSTTPSSSQSTTPQSQNSSPLLEILKSPLVMLSPVFPRGAFHSLTITNTYSTLELREDQNDHNLFFAPGEQYLTLEVYYDDSEFSFLEPTNSDYISQCSTSSEVSVF